MVGNAPVPSPSAASPSFSESWVPSDLYEFAQVPSASPGFSGTAGVNGHLVLPPESFSNIPGGGTQLQWTMQPAGLTDQDAAVRRGHLAYYFNHVRGLQFLFTSKTGLDAVQAVSTDVIF